ncbi:MAG: STAS domain-containing protein [Pseudomonadota bacterium]
MTLNTSVAENAEKSLLRVGLAGSLDSDTAPELEPVLDEAVAGTAELVVLDMAELDYISSAGLRVIFKASKALKAAGRRLAVAKRQPQIEKVFEILQALPDMAVFADDDELDEYLDAMQAKTRGT